MSQDKVAKHAVSVGLLTLLSRVLGYIRDSINAALFGAGLVSDAYFVAFRIPNLLRDLVAEGSFTAAFVPTFSHTLEKEGEEKAWEVASLVLNLLVIFLVCIVALGIIASPFIVHVMAPNFSNTPHKAELTILLTKILFPFIGFVSLSAFFMGILNSHKSFTLPALAPSLFNITMILTGRYICPLFGADPQNTIIGWSYGALLGSLIQMGVQIPLVMKYGFKYSLKVSFTHPSVRRMFSLLFPAIVGLSVTQINLVINTIIAAWGPDGSVTYLYYGNRLMQLPLALFGISVATVILPLLSQQVARGSREEVRQLFSQAIRLVFFLILPASVGLCVLSYPINSMLFRHGNFDSNDVSATALTSIYYSLGLFAYAGIRVTQTVYYAYLDTWTPLKIGLISIVLNIALNIAFIHPLSYCGPALATSMSATVSFVFLLIFLRRKMQRIMGRQILLSFIKILFASGIMGLISYYFNNFSTNLLANSIGFEGNTFNQLLEIIITISFSIIIYYILCIILRIEERVSITNLLRRKTL